MARLEIRAAGTTADDVLEAYRRDHEAVRDELQAIQHLVEVLPDVHERARPASMLAIVAGLNRRIRGHAEHAERVLYPRLACELGDVDGLLAAFRHEHRLIGRRIDELEDVALGAEPGLRTFVRRAEQLIGLLAAHLDAEEAVLLSRLPAAAVLPLPALPLG